MKLIKNQKEFNKKKLEDEFILKKNYLIWLLNRSTFKPPDPTFCLTRV
jgi:hypothetical protein